MELFIPQIQQLNHDLNLLYAIARTQLPKDILEGLMYGSEFEDPSDEYLEGLQMIIDSNKTRIIDAKEECYKVVNDAACKDMDTKLDKAIMENINASKY